MVRNYEDYFGSDVSTILDYYYLKICANMRNKVLDSIHLFVNNLNFYRMVFKSMCNKI